MAVHTAGLPATFPSSAAIDAAARLISATGTVTDSIRDDVQTHWNGMNAVFKSPHQAKVYTAVSEVMSPFIDATVLVTEGAAKALEAFADDMTNLKARYDNVVSRAGSHNGTSWADQDDDYWSTNGEVQREVNAVAGLYDAAVAKCSGALQNLIPVAGVDAKDANRITTFASNGLDLLEAAGVGAAQFTFKNGKLLFQYGPGNNFGRDMRDSPFRIGAGSLERLGVPDSYIQRLANSQGPNAVRMSNNFTQNMIRDAAPGSALAAMTARYPWLKNIKLNGTGNNMNFQMQVTPGPRVPPGTQGVANGTAGILKPLKKAEELFKGPTGKLLGAVGYGLTFAGSYTEGYNGSLQRNPGKSEGEHHLEATKDAATITAASGIGAAVGTGVGRVAGAALGQALIPIPGVGAAVGGFVGGLVGGWVGGNIGGAVGGLLNDIRHGDKSFGEAALDAGKNLLSSFNPFA